MAKANEQVERLRKWNFWLAGLHAVQAVAVLVFSTSRTFPVHLNLLTTDTIQTQVSGHTVLAPAIHHVADVNMAYLIALFFLFSAVAHLSLATWYRGRYESELKDGINRLRWFEYSLSASTMIVAIGLLTGVYDLGSLALLFGLTAVMNLMGLVMETHNPWRRSMKVKWLSFIVGSIAGIVPWLVLALYLLATSLYGSGRIPTFVFFIYGTIFLCFMSFALNMCLQYARKGKWANYYYGERAYMVLSLVAKSLLAWQVFAGALRP